MRVRDGCVAFVRGAELEKQKVSTGRDNHKIKGKRGQNVRVVSSFTNSTAAQSYTLTNNGLNVPSLSLTTISMNALITFVSTAVISSAEESAARRVHRRSNAVRKKANVGLSCALSASRPALRRTRRRRSKKAPMDYVRVEGGKEARSA